MRLLGLAVPYNTYLMAGILDGINWLVWAKTEDGSRGVNRPKSIAQSLSLEALEAKKELRTFRTGEDFIKAREKLLGGSKDGN